MSFPKLIFQKDKEACDRLQAVTHSDWFKTALAFARAELMDLPGITTDNLVGASKYEAIILGLADKEESDLAAVDVKLLHHDLDDPQRKPVKPEIKK